MIEKNYSSLNSNKIQITGARQNNLQNVDISIPKNQLVVITGPSGSGKSSLAFETIYAEGQRRYLESLSSYARQFLNMHEKPEFDSIHGLAPTIAINQKTTSNNPRSTVGTITEIYDYLRLLFARIGTLFSPTTGQPIKKQTTSQIIENIMQIGENVKINLLAPVVRHQKGEHLKNIEKIKKNGFQRVRIDNLIYQIDEVPELEKNKYHDIEVLVDRFTINEENRVRIASSVEVCTHLTEGLVYVEIVGLADDFLDLGGLKKSGSVPEYKVGHIIKYCEKFVCIETGFSLSEIEPRSFSFNNTNSACEKCQGLGVSNGFDEDLIIETINETIEQTINKIVKNSYLNQELAESIKNFLQDTPFFLQTKWSDLSSEVRKRLLYGDNKGSSKKENNVNFDGLINYLAKLESYYGMGNLLKNYQSNKKCTACNGYRLKSDILNVKINNLHIGEVCELTIAQASVWFEDLVNFLDTEEQQIGQKIIKEIIARLTFLGDVGLDYLIISRPAGSLSGGENQRIRLASQIGSALSGVIYVLDEPSIGLHQSDNDRLIQTLKKLRDLDNSVLVVEHDEDTMREADYLIDMGPGAGIHGGNIIAQGTPQQVAANQESLTGSYLSGVRKIEIPNLRRAVDDKRKIILHGAQENNLKNLDIEFPLGLMLCVTGVSGSGKSTLVFDTLQEIMRRKFGLVSAKPGKYAKVEGLEQIDKFIEIDQSPIGRTPRSNPATYTGIFDLVRAVFASLPESKARGYKVGRFSFNVEGGRCETCQGDGCKKIEMHFLPDVFIDCEVCAGKRYNRETLEIEYRQKNIAEVLAMSIDEASEFFDKFPNIKEKLNTLQDVGLGYLTLGQSVTTISGGESQRIKLAKELSKRSTGKTIYFLDEPTTGLHTHDIKNLLNVLQRLIENGNSMFIIEHNLDIIKCADYIIDIGPGGGEKGGYIVAQGTPEQVADNSNSLTGKYLKKYLI